MVYNMVMTIYKPHYKNSQIFNYNGKKYAYSTIHNWLHNNYGSATKCENSKCLKRSKRFNWANISGEYRRDLKDWEQLCVSCHRLKDYTEEQRIRLSLSHRKNPHKKIYQYDLSKNLVAVFDSVRSASRATGASPTGIYNNLAGRSRNSAGYLWKEA